MPPFRPWADLPPDLLRLISDSLDLKCYGSARVVCTTWRCALAPPSPWLLVVLGAARCCLSAVSLPRNGSLYLKPIPSGGQCVGSSDGWLALSYDGKIGKFSLFNPITATEIILPPMIYKRRWVANTKIVFAPNPSTDNFAAVAICEVDRLAYVTAGARRWAVLDPLSLTGGDHLVDIVYHEKGGKGRVYCLTHYGDVHVLCLPDLRRKTIMVDHDPAEQEHDLVLGRSFGPDLNAPAKLEPLLSIPFDRATSFTPPYDTITGLTRAKYLVFCEGNLYQIWRNLSSAVTLQCGRRLAENEVLALRYYPRRRRLPCWQVVTDLGGYSVFLGTNNAVSMAQGGFQGLKGNRVYWIDERVTDQGMVFDMATGRTTACLLPAAAAEVVPQSAICWYFSSDNWNNNEGKRVYWTRARVRADREKEHDMEE